MCHSMCTSHFCWLKAALPEADLSRAGIHTFYVLLVAIQSMLTSGVPDDVIGQSLWYGLNILIY